MKIVHIAANAPYNDYWGYQDNLLPKYHKKLGHDVSVIITNTEHKDGKIVEVSEADYFLNDGVRIIRKKWKKYPGEFLTRLFAKFDIFETLKEIKPDFIFVHGLLSRTIFDVIKYKKSINPKCVIVSDNHLDYNIGYVVDTIKAKIKCRYYKYINRKAAPYISKVYGVTPWRKKYAEEYFGISPQKTDVLIMGADDEKLDFENRHKIRTEIREKYQIKDTDFLIVTGGKIDKKKKIDLLIKAASDTQDVKLLVFGNVLPDIEEEFDELIKSSQNIIYIGWIDSDKVYDYFFAADIVIFPGQHSVLWEQACASKVPCLFEKWEGMEHVDCGGNSEFVFPITVEELKKKILKLKYTDKYYEMKSVAESNATDIYLYSKIAEKSLECAYNEN